MMQTGLNVWRWMLRLNARIEGCWVGDLLAVVGLFALMIMITIGVGVLQ